ncbi:ubiquinone/menaquinone biosynthesis methyltransferase [Desulfocurvus sp. DL9XJH121]
MLENDPREQAGRVRQMFGRIAGWYDFLNHFLSLGLDIVWRRRLVRAVRPGRTGRILDLAAGTMDVTRALLDAHPGARVLAMDFARPMLERGLPKVSHQARDVLPVLADGRSLPLPESCVDGVTIAFGIRNIRPRQAAYAEILRVLAPGGRLAILEFGSSRRPIWKGLYNFYLNGILPLVGRLISGDRKAYSYLAETIADFPTAPDLERELRDAGFVRVDHESLLSGIVNIHVAERPLSNGLYVMGAPRDAQAAPRPEPEEDPVGITARCAANTAAGLKAMEAALVPAAKAPKAKAKTKTAAAGTEKAPAKKAPAAKAAKKPAAPGAAKKATAKKTAAKAGTAKATTKKAAPKATAKKPATPKKTAAKKTTK